MHVMANHEFYGTEINEAGARLAEECAEVAIHLFDQDMARIRDTRFIRAMLCTDLTDLELEGKAEEVEAKMRVCFGLLGLCGAIHHRGRRFATGESVRRHRAHPSYLEHELERARRAGDRAVVVTHHAPSARSIRPWFEGDPLNPAFASNLDRLIERHQPALWIHGHMHDPVDQWLGKTRLLANPAGYRHENKRGFNPELCVEVDDPPTPPGK